MHQGNIKIYDDDVIVIRDKDILDNKISMADAASLNETDSLDDFAL